MQDFKFSHKPAGSLPFAGAAAGFGQDSRYRRAQVVDLYDSKSNPLQVTQENGNSSSYLWGYNQSYPIAEVKNAPHHEVYHSNFEESSGWDGAMQYVTDRARAGRVSGRIVNGGVPEVVSHSTQWLDLSPNSDAGLAQTRKFRYSAWYYSDAPPAEMFLFMKTKADSDAGAYFSLFDRVETQVTGKWTLLEKEFEVPAGVKYLRLRLDNNGTGTVWFDDVRIQPADAQMTTYTHEPLVGMTSVTDDNGKTVFYEYDGFGRLKAVKDHEGNVLQTHEYRYKGQQ